MLIPAGIQQVTLLLAFPERWGLPGCEQAGDTSEVLAVFVLQHGAHEKASLLPEKGGIGIP